MGETLSQKRKEEKRKKNVYFSAEFFMCSLKMGKTQYAFDSIRSQYFHSYKRYYKLPGGAGHPSVPAFERHTQVIWEFLASLVYRASIRTACSTQGNVSRGRKTKKGMKRCYSIK